MPRARIGAPVCTAAGLLNAFERCGDFLEIGGPALFLRHTSATAWDNAFINFDERGWFPAPNYVVMKLWRDHYAPERDRGGRRVGTAEPRRHAVRGCQDLLREGGQSRGCGPAGRRCRWPATTSSAPPSCSWLHRVHCSARNTMEQPEAVASEARKRRDGTAAGIRFTLPAQSAAVVSIPLQ